MPHLTAEQAALVAEACLRDTLQTVQGASWLGVAMDLCGLPAAPEWVSGEVFEQRGAGFGQRLDHALAHARTRTVRQLVLIGMDTPQVTVADIRALASPPTDFCLGFASDGGFWGLGCRADIPPVFADIPMSVTSTGADTWRALRRHGSISRGPDLMDVDDIRSADTVARAAAGSQFARVYRLARPLGTTEVTDDDR